MPLEDALAEAMAAIPDCVACGYADTADGSLLAARTTVACSEADLGTVAAAVCALLRSGAAAAVERRFQLPRDIGDLGQASQEFALLSGNLLHLFVRSRAKPEHMLCVACRRGANVGLALSKSRAAVEPVAAAL